MIGIKYKDIDKDMLMIFTICYEYSISFTNMLKLFIISRKYFWTFMEICSPMLKMGVRKAATLKKSVDGDTAHFFIDTYGHVVQGRFNGVDTPESTGIIEEWGKAASNFTKDKLENAKTIVLETERLDGLTGPEADSTSNRYLVWVWTSTRSLEEEDGSGLRLLNLELVQNGYSPSKGNAGSKYEEVFLDADAQAQKFKLNIWSEDTDPLFYYGEAQITNMQEVFSNPSEWLGAKVYVEELKNSYVAALCLTSTDGVVSNVSEYCKFEHQLDESSYVNMRLIRVSAAINAGNSGGGLYDISGKLVGIVNGKIVSTEYDNVGFAIPVNIAARLADKIIAVLFLNFFIV